MAVCQHDENIICSLCVKQRRATDPVEWPAHYTSDPSGIQQIEVTRWRNFNIGNAMKYLWRNGLKDADAQVQDLRKAIWYIEDEIARLEGKHGKG